MQWMRRDALLLPVLLAMAASGSAQSYGQPRYAAPAVAPSSGIDWALADWRRLRQGGNFAFADYARFLNANPGWPGEATLRANAERAMRAGESPATVLTFYASQQPQSGNGFARLADALSASGRPAEAMVAAREAWGSGDLAAYDEQSVFARFGAGFSRQDHDRRADALLFDKRPGDAQRFLAMVSPERAGAFAARIAMQRRAPDAEARYQPYLTRVTSDAGLMMDRARYLRDGGLESSARQLFARPRTLSYRPADPENFYEMMLLLARGAAAEGQWSTAYNIARQVDDVFPAGSDISLKSLGIRDDYTSLTWLAGSAALDALGRPADAIGLFERYSRGGRSLQVASKGLYWAGRAAASAGRLPDSSLYFQRAASYPELFYGQLALERIGRSVTPPLASVPLTSAAQRSAFDGNRLVRAVRLLGNQGRRDDQALFVRALAESLATDGDRHLAVELGQQIGRQDLPVWVARAARNKGSAFYVRPAYPTLPSNSLDGRLWSLSHGITRQESSFDRTAVSHAGARGLMQLMVPTAREQAGKMGLAYDTYRLTAEPNYNVMLGSAYFSRLLNTWDGNVPLAVASYNAGAGNVRKWINAYGDPRGGDVLRWIERIPFAETKGYVQRVIENSVVYDSMRAPAATQSAMHVSRYLGKSRPG
jgi:soluble lytic murein transglycosylase